MKKLLLITGLAAIFLLNGCDNKTVIERNQKNTERVLSKKTETEICKNGITYYETFYELGHRNSFYDTSIKFTPDSKVVPCSNP